MGIKPRPNSNSNPISPLLIGAIVLALISILLILFISPTMPSLLDTPITKKIFTPDTVTVVAVHNYDYVYEGCRFSKKYSVVQNKNHKTGRICGEIGDIGTEVSGCWVDHNKEFYYLSNFSLSCPPNE